MQVDQLSHTQRRILSVISPKAQTAQEIATSLKLPFGQVAQELAALAGANLCVCIYGSSWHKSNRYQR